MTYITSAFWTVLSRCAMDIVVRPFEARSIAAWTACSDVESRAEVASSRSLLGSLERMVEQEME
jgi:hypothetical protein